MNIKPSEIGELKKHPILDGLPESLKDKKKYKIIEKKLHDVMISDHGHKNLKSFEKCERCNEKLEKRRQIIKDYGFVDYHQYLIWRQVMQIIINAKDFSV